MKTGQKIDFKINDKGYSGIYINSNDNYTTIKLDTGYNITLRNDSLKISKVYDMDNGVINQSNTVREPEIQKDKKTYILTTGGTIGSSIDYKTGAVKPVKDISYIYNFVNNISQYEIKHENIDSILSENVDINKWINFARKAKEKLDKGYGVVFFHGTDTMQYSSAALSFMFEQQTAPILFTGSQRSPDRPSSDAFVNIEGSINFSSADIGEVCISMHSSTSDNSVSLHRGVRARKMHTSRRDAFRSIDAEEIGVYQNGRVKLNGNYKKAGEKNILKDKLDENVSIVYFYPGMDESQFQNIASDKKAVVIMGTGLGHVSENIINAIKKLSKDTYFFMTSQCINGSVNLNVYSTGRELLNAGVIPLYDMLPEVAMVKAMYLLANYPDNFTNLMKQNLRGEINNRILIGDF